MLPRVASQPLQIILQAQRKTILAERANVKLMVTSMYTLPDRSCRSTQWKIIWIFLAAWVRLQRLAMWPTGFPLQPGCPRPYPGPGRSIRALVRHYSPPSSLSSTARMQCSLTPPSSAIGIFKYLSGTSPENKSGSGRFAGMWHFKSAVIMLIC